jgi:hypothetical protein
MEMKRRRSLMYVSWRRVGGAVAVRRIEVVSTRSLQSDDALSRFRDDT